jgi:hypothetical protein
LQNPAISPQTYGLYLARLPHLSKLDLHVEGSTTDPISHRAEGGHLFYWELTYKDMYTNKGYLMGSWLGREATGGQAWTTYWFSPQSTLRVGYRYGKTSQFFVPQGETQDDVWAEMNYAWRHDITFQVLVQEEHWTAPLLSATPQTDMTAQVGLLFQPKDWRQVGHAPMF